MEIPCFQVDAFTDRPFSGNPAAICPLERWLADALLQAIAFENNVSETAFIVPRGDDPEDATDFDLRWFTPETEVDLCGHATLATAFVLDRPEVRFHTRSGLLVCTRADKGAYTLDFPSRPPERVADDSLAQAIAVALGAAPRELWQARDLVALYDDQAIVRALRPDFAAVAKLPTFALCVTAPGDGGADFVSRFFAPQKGVPEDPVTGSAHCTLTPMWAEKLGKQTLRARQVSRRGGELLCELAGDRVRMTGRAVLMRSGVFHVTGAYSIS